MSTWPLILTHLAVLCLGALLFYGYTRYMSPNKHHSDTSKDKESTPESTASSKHDPRFRALLHSKRQQQKQRLFDLNLEKLELLHGMFEDDHALMKDQLAKALSGRLKKDNTYNFHNRSQVLLFSPSEVKKRFEQFNSDRAMLVDFINQISERNNTYSNTNMPRNTVPSELNLGQERLLIYQHNHKAIQKIIEDEMEVLLDNFTTKG